MSEAIIILQNMRGGCATVGDKVHTLFRVSGRRLKADPQNTEGESEAAAVSIAVRDPGVKDTDNEAAAAVDM